MYSFDNFIIYFLQYSYFTTEMDLSGIHIDMALRIFQTYFRMPVCTILDIIYFVLLANLVTMINYSFFCIII